MALFTIQPVRLSTSRPCYPGNEISRVPVQTYLSIKEMAKCSFNLEAGVLSVLQGERPCLYRNPLHQLA